MADPVSILVIEGDPSLAGTIVRILGDAGYAVRIESSIEAAADKGRGLQAADVRAIVHELNQPLTAVMGYAELLKRRLAEGTPDHRYAATIMEEAARLSTIVRRLARLARGDECGDGAQEGPT